MAILNILEFPDPRLRTLAKPVTEFDDALRQLIDDMFENMYEAPGIGLAATQVNVHKQVVVMDLSEDRSEPRVFINPSVEELTHDMGQYQEGCLSVPGFYENVDRPLRERVSGSRLEARSVRMDHAFLDLVPADRRARNRCCEPMRERRLPRSRRAADDNEDGSRHERGFSAHPGTDARQ